MNQFKEYSINTFENTPIGKCITGLDGKFVQVNNALCKFFGYLKKELLEKTFLELTFPDDIPDSNKNMEDLKSQKRKHFSLEKRYIHKSGNVIWGFTSVTAIYNNKNNLEYFIAECQDIG
jgi:PAS domain S-box-containing protein